MIEQLIINKCYPDVISIEFHPYFQSISLVNYCKKNNIPIIGYRTFAQGKIFKDQIIKDIAKKHKCSISEIVLLWSLNLGIIPTISSSNHENFNELIKFTSDKNRLILDENDLYRMKSLNLGPSGSTCMIKYCKYDE